MEKVLFSDLGMMDYKVCWDLQERIFNQVVSRKLHNRDPTAEEKFEQNHHLFFVEHPHVYTLGKSGKEDHLLLNTEGLNEKNASYYKINRGGDITYHGPGQIVGYPILDLDCFFTDIHKYLRLLEESIIRTLDEFGIRAGRSNGETGVWLDAEIPGRARKICAMGVRCSRWVTMHGFALNVNCELDYFNNIIPCGIRDKSVTSIKNELGKTVNLEEVKTLIKKHFAELFSCELISNPTIDLEIKNQTL
jgi:lipoyl(octanoyl) transferase